MPKPNQVRKNRSSSSKKPQFQSKAVFPPAGGLKLTVQSDDCAPTFFKGDTLTAYKTDPREGDIVAVRFQATPYLLRFKKRSRGFIECVSLHPEKAQKYTFKAKALDYIYLVAYCERIIKVPDKRDRHATSAPRRVPVIPWNRA